MTKRFAFGHSDLGIDSGFGLLVSGFTQARPIARDPSSRLRGLLRRIQWVRGWRGAVAARRTRGQQRGGPRRQRGAGESIVPDIALASLGPPWFMRSYSGDS